MTQERLAEEAEVDPRTVREWECGRQRPRTFQLVERIGEILEVSIEELGLPQAVLLPALPMPAGSVIELSSRMTGPPEAGALVGLSEERIEVAVDDTIQLPSARRGRYTVRLVDRRTFVSLALTFPVSLTADHLDRLGAALTTSRVDALAADGLGRMAAACWRAYEEVPARDLMPHVQWQIRFLGQLQATSTSLQPRITTLLGSMLALAGDLSFWEFADPQKARRCLERALAAADEAGDRQVRAYALGSLAYVTAYGESELPSAVQAAVQSQELAATGGSGQTASRAAAIAAEMHAKTGNEAGYRSSVDRARAALASASGDPPTWIGSGGFDAVWLRWYEAGGLLRLRRPEAVDGLQWVRGQLLSEHRSSACMVTADVAQALVQAGEIAEGCRYADETLTLATQFGHGESARRVKALCREDLRQHGDHPTVRALFDRIMAL